MIEDINPVIWLSIASKSGLSLISLGTIGSSSKKTVDEQMFSGGLLAAQTILGAEVGVNEDRFISGSDIHKVGRFVLKNDLVGQFLLISESRIKISQVLLDFYEMFLSILAEKCFSKKLIDLDVLEEIKIREIVDLCLETIEECQKKIKVPTNPKFINNALFQILADTIDDFNYSTTLIEISKIKGNYEEVIGKLKNNYNYYIDNLSKEVIAEVIKKFPNAVSLYPKLNSKNFLNKTFIKMFKNSFKEIEFRLSTTYSNLINSFEEKNLDDFLQQFQLQDVQKANLQEALQRELLSMFISNYPLLVIIEPEILGLKEEIDKLANKITDRYNLGGTLARIASQMLIEADATKKQLLLDFLTTFCNQFPAGLTSVTWKYLVYFFKIIETLPETKTTLVKQINEMKNEIPPTHLKMLKEIFQRYDVQNIDTISFEISSTAEILSLSRALLPTVASSLDEIIVNLLTSDDEEYNYLKRLNKNIYDFSRLMQHIYGIFLIYSHFESLLPSLNFKASFGYKSDFLKHFQKEKKKKISLGDLSIIEEMDPELVVTFNNETTIHMYNEEHRSIERKNELMKEKFYDQIKQIKKFLSNQPETISKGFKLENTTKYLLRIKEPLYDHYPKLLEEEEKDFEKIYYKLSDELAKVQENAQKLIKGGISEGKFNKNVRNANFPDKISKDFDKLYDKWIKKLQTEYNTKTFSIGKKFKGPILKKAFKLYSKPCDTLVFKKKKSSDYKAIHSTINGYLSKKHYFGTYQGVSLLFYTMMNQLPSELTNRIIDSLVRESSLEFLETVKKKFKSTKKEDISFLDIYKETISEDIKNRVIDVFKRITQPTINWYIRSSPKVLLLQDSDKDELLATVELGTFRTQNIAESFESILKDFIHTVVDESNKETIYRVFFVIPSKGLDMNKIKKQWKTKNWNLKNMLVVVTWEMILQQYSAIIDILRLSAHIYSKTAQELFNELLLMIGKEMLYH